MNAAIQKFETVSFLRGGRISGFLDRQRTTFFVSKKLMEVTRIDENGKAVRVPEWIIDLDAPVDVTALLREREDDETAIAQAQFASQLLEGSGGRPNAGSSEGGGVAEAVDVDSTHVLLRNEPESGGAVMPSRPPGRSGIQGPRHGLASVGQSRIRRRRRLRRPEARAIRQLRAPPRAARQRATGLAEWPAGKRSGDGAGYAPQRLLSQRMSNAPPSPAAA